MINYEFPPIGGGGGVAAANLAAALVKRGHEVDYVTTHYPGFPRTEVWEGVNLYRVPVIGRKDLHTATIVSMLSYPPIAIRRGLSLARRKSYNVIHTHFAIPSGPAGYVLSRKLKLPHVMSIYGGDIYDPSKSYSPHKHPVLKRVVKSVLNQADVVVGESADICARAEEHFAPKTRTIRIPLGFCPPQFDKQSRTELGMDENLVYAVAVSRLIPRKDYTTLLRAVKQADVENLRLLIIGDGPELEKLSKLTNDLGINDKVSFKGALDDSAKFAYLHAADFFALSPLHEGYGIVFQEAMFCGLPIVTTNNGGHTDFLNEGRNALLSPPGDVNSMAESLRSVSSKQGLRSEMSHNNSSDIEPQLIGYVAKQYEEIYGSILTSGKPRVTAANAKERRI